MSVKTIAKSILNRTSGPGEFSWGSAISTGVNGYFAYSTFSDARENGDSFGSSIMQGGRDLALGYVLGPGAYIALDLAKELPGAITSGAETMGQMGRSMARTNLNTPFTNAQFTDSQQAFTMRQAGMQAAQKSKYALNQAILGNEARYLHC